MVFTDGIHALENSAEHQLSWNRFLDDSAGATFYHRFEWKSVYEAEFGHDTFYLASTQDGTINGVLPLVFLRSRLFGRILCSLPFVNYCGPVALSREVESRLVERACELADEFRADYLEIRGKHICADSLSSSTNKVSLTLSLSDDAEEIWNAFTSKHRKNIRRAYKNGLEVRSGHLELLDVFYDLLCQSWRDLGTPIYHKRYFRKILEVFGNNARVFVACREDVPVATAFVGNCGDTVEGMWAGSPFAHRRLQPNYVLYWEMIKAACDNGYKRFHLGRSSVDSGSETFKKKWQADTEQLYWQYYMPSGGDIPQLNVQNSKFSLAINAWRRMPLALTRLIGPMLARNIP